MAPMSTRWLTGALAGGLMLATAGEAWSQAVEQAETVRRRQEMDRQLQAGAAEELAPELFKGELEDVGPQSILKVKKRKQYLDAGVDSQFFYTSNTGLTEAEDDSTLMVHTVSLALAPDPLDYMGGKFQPRLGYRHQFFNYALLGSRAAAGVVDFDVQAVFTDLRYSWGKNWSYAIGAEYLRLVDHFPTFSSYKEFYKEWVPRYEVTRFAFLSESRFFTFSYQGLYHLSDSPRDPVNPKVQNRIEQVFVLAYTHALSPRLTLQPFYRLVYSHYTDQNDRNDHLHTTGLSVFYSFNEWLSVRAFLTYDARESDATVPVNIPDYRKLDLGIGVNVSRRF